MDAWTEQQQLDFLKKYGYAAVDLSSWAHAASHASSELSSTWPQLHVNVEGHQEKDGHTWYLLECKLDLPSNRTMPWLIEHRLRHLREHLYQPTCQALESETAEGAVRLRKAPFALRGGLPGTSNRLRGWLAELAECINTGHCQPSLVSLALRFLSPPEPPRLSTEAAGYAKSAASRFYGAVGAAKSKVQQQFDETRQQINEQVTGAAVGFAKQNPKAATAMMGSAMGCASANPGVAQGGKTALGFMAKNPKLAMGALSTSVKTAAKLF